MRVYSEYEIWAMEQELESMLALNPKSKEFQEEIALMEASIKKARKNKPGSRAPGQ